MSWLRLLLIVAMVSGCAEKILTQWPQQHIFNSYFRLQEVKLGMSRGEVEAIMGPAQVREEGDFRRGRLLLSFYRTHNMDYDGSGTVRGGYTPLIFEQDLLVGKGKRDYLKAVDRPWVEDSPLPSWQRSW